jgi:tetratricopeptide (TPR) repeat protein
MSDATLDRYREAMRRGHTALAKDRFADALAAYHDAATLQPDRPLPLNAMGQVQLRQGRPGDALTAYEAALARVPRDETALVGRAEALSRLGRRTDAAAAFDVLADVQEADGRLDEALESIGRALDLAEQKARRRRLQDLTRRVRLAAGEAVPAAPTPTRTARSTGATAARQPDEPAPSVPAAGTPDEPAPIVADEVTPTIEAAPAEEPARPAEPAPPPDPVALTGTAEAAVDRGDLDAARRAYLAAAAAFEDEALLASAIDACYQALAFAPDDADVHLRLVELYLDAGWATPAADKLALLGRLTELDDRRGAVRARIVGLAADHFPDDPRLRRLSAPKSAGR